MKTGRVTINPADPASLALGRIDTARVDATTEEDIFPGDIRGNGIHIFKRCGRPD